MLRVGIATLALLLGVCVAACAPFVPSGTASGTDETGRAVGILWSTEEGPRSYLQLSDGQTVKEQLTIPAVGIFATTDAPTRRGGRVYFVANGDQKQHETSLIEFSEETARFRTIRLGEPMVLSFALASDGFFTTNTRNGAAEVHKRDYSGRELTATSLDGVAISELVLYEDRLYAFATNFNKNDAQELIVLSPKDLKRLSTVALPLRDETAGVWNAFATNGLLFYPETLSAAATQGRRLHMLDVTSMERSTIDLTASSPFLIRVAEDAIYVAHTFMNPGFGPMSEYRHLTRIDLSSNAVSDFELDVGITQIEPARDRLYVLGVDSDDQPVLETYSLPTMNRLTRMSLEAPQAGGYYYVAGMFAPVR